MDPFEEFEFKPLTEGLGFHKKKSAAAKAEAEADSFKASSPNILKSSGLELIDEGSVDPLRPPLPRKKTPSTLPTAPGNLTEVGGDGSSSTAAVDEILKTLQKNRRFDFDENKSKNKITATPTKDTYKASHWSFSAAILDGMLVIAASLLCMIILLLITKVDLIGNLTHPDEAYMIYAATAAIFGGVSFIYLTVNRIFMGATPGEWAFDQRVGQPEELPTGIFALKVAARSALVVLTGFIVFPIISAILGKDFAGQITGARLLRKA